LKICVLKIEIRSYFFLLKNPGLKFQFVGVTVSVEPSEPVELGGPEEEGFKEQVASTLAVDLWLQALLTFSTGSTTDSASGIGVLKFIKIK